MAYLLAIVAAVVGLMVTVQLVIRESPWPASLPPIIAGLVAVPSPDGR
jgi:hypothetical protein